MHAFHLFSLLVLFITGLNSTVTFISPAGGDIWTVGQTQTISWTEVSTADNPNGDYLSVRLYQVFPNGTTSSTNFEYLIQQAVPETVNVNPAGWSVNLDATKGINSTVSNTYILALYLETEIAILAQSDVFIINNTTAPFSPSSTSSAFSSTTSSALTTGSASTPSLATSITTPSAAAISSSTAATSKTAPGALSSGEKAMIGIGVSAAVILGIALGWFLFGRRKQQNGKIPTTVMPLYSDKQSIWPGPASMLSDYSDMSSKSGAVPTTYAELPETCRI